MHTEKQTQTLSIQEEYKYKTVRTVCQKDMRYIQWLLNNEDFVWKGEKMMLLLEDIRNTVEELRIN